MELEKQIIKKCVEKGSAFSQITLEDDYIIPDSRPDVRKVIHTRGNVVFEEPRISNQALWINGRVDFHVLYRSEDEETKLENVEGSVPFQEKLSMDGLEETDRIRLTGYLEDLSASIINSRKLAVRALVEFRAAAENEETVELATGLVDAEEQVQTRIQQYQVANLKYSQKDVLRIRKELELPTARPNIGELLFQSVDVRNLEGYLENDAIVVQGEAKICVLYRSEGDGTIECCEISEPIQGRVDSRLSDGTGIAWITVEPGAADVAVREDYDGEQRGLGVEMNFDIEAKVWTEENVPVLADLYALDRTVIPGQQKLAMERLLVQNQTKLRLADQFSLEEDQEKILQICCCCGAVHLESLEMEERGLMAEGTLSVHLLYRTGDELLPVSHTQVFLPIEQLVEFPRSDGEVRYHLQAGMEQLQANLLDGAAFEVKAMVSLNVIAFEEVIVDNMTEVEEEPLDREELQRQPGIVGYVVKEGELLWDIARKYHTTVDRISSANDISAEDLPTGRKLLIVKTV